MKKKDDKQRRFLGTLDPYNDKIKDNYVKDLSASEYMTFHKKHLKAYLQGSTHFRYKGNVYKVKFSYGNETDNSKEISEESQG